MAYLQPRPRGTSSFSRAAWSALLCLLLITAADLLRHYLNLPPPAEGLLDGSAHLATALLVLLALPALSHVVYAPVFLVTSVVIDVDHVPVLFGNDVITAGTGRPYSHSLTTVIFFGLLAVVTKGMVRKVLAGLALGVLAHFLRDIATGSGLALVWPFSTAMVRLPYLLYLAVLLGLATVAVSTAGRASGRSGSLNLVSQRRGQSAEADD